MLHDSADDAASVVVTTAVTPTKAAAVALTNQDEPCQVSPLRLLQQAPEAPIMALLRGLRQAFATERAAGYTIDNEQPPESFDRLNGTVKALLSEYTARCSDWKQFAFFNDHHYVRNLVEVNEDFELIVLCWKRGQGSRVHNHANSHCWLSVAQGGMLEVQYKQPPTVGRQRSFNAKSPNLPGVIAAEAPCPPIKEIGSTPMKVGDVGYISDRIALHAVKCPEDVEGLDGVTIHLYAPPIRRVKLYEPEEGRVVTRTPGFFTVQGQKA